MRKMRKETTENIAAAVEGQVIEVIGRGRGAG